MLYPDTRTVVVRSVLISSAMAKYEAFRKGPYMKVSLSVPGGCKFLEPHLPTFVAAHNIDPRHKIQMIASFLKGVQLRGSLGSSLGCGDRTICEFLPVPCLRFAV